MQIKQQCVKPEFMIQEYISFKALVPTHQTTCNRISAGVLGFNLLAVFGVFGRFSWVWGFLAGFLEFWGFGGGSLRGNVG